MLYFLQPSHFQFYIIIDNKMIMQFPPQGAGNLLSVFEIRNYSDFRKPKFQLNNKQTNTHTHTKHTKSFRSLTFFLII